MIQIVPGPVDIHSHLVPDVDDGARGVDGALAAIGRLMETGTRRIITTPHLDASLHEEPGQLEARIEEVRAAFDLLRDAAIPTLPDLDLRLGFEVMLDSPDLDFGDPRLRLGGTRFALVEWPGMHIPPMGSGAILRRMIASGVRPVIAHPERYREMEERFDVAREWVGEGALLQINWGSLVGRYGPVARRVALRLLRHGLASYLASDFHGREHLAVNYDEAQAAMEEVGGLETFRVLTETNPRRLSEDEEPMPAPLLPEETGFVARIRRMIGADR